ncbi:MAG: HDOD domain-containing protein [Verrucomicrobiota bacterium]
MESPNLSNRFAGSGTSEGGAGSSESQTAPPFVSPAEWRVLFVGGDALWFDQIKHDLICLEPYWRPLHAPDGATAAGMLAVQPVHAVIVDSRAQGARELIENLKKAGDQALRMLRCDMSDRQVVNAWKGLGVPMITSLGDATRIVASLLRNCRLRDWSADPAMQRLLPQIRKLPATPVLYAKVSEELSSPSGSLNVVAQLICHDPVMSAKMLQIANSALFAASREVTDMLEAVMILGSERIKSLILLSGVFSQYSDAKDSAASIQPLLAHSIQVGGFARAIALNETKSSRAAEAAFTAGVLHDIGKLILAGNLPEKFGRARALAAERKLSAHEAEMEVFGVSHARFGACLLAAWGLPLPILEAVAWHHEPAKSSDTGFSLLAAVHAANVFAHQAAPQAGPAGQEPLVSVNQPYLDGIGLGGCCDRWRASCGIPAAAPA